MLPEMARVERVQMRKSRINRYPSRIAIIKTEITWLEIGIGAVQTESTSGYDSPHGGEYLLPDLAARKHHADP
ncbi:hypothetical protein GCM10010096_31720 [Alcaligenes pakistanensis]|uniref:Uncharacterized protein n=1 Tax=Alcaligenes pakistanensis TaxID=1482717 RepID=A0A8H9IKD9_9BURK|nr:hypothetical protein GCM10010096_31720 [Alcaligenes pakistanensis]